MAASEEVDMDIKFEADLATLVTEVEVDIFLQVLCCKLHSV